MSTEATIDWDERVNVTLTRWQARIVAMWIKGELSMVDNPYAPYPHPADIKRADRQTTYEWKEWNGWTRL